ncbi:hypothetical protein VU08_08430 [Desulfobulbus sp. F5]|nr:hypothetical protein [Desulfobulbus sp. F5]
MSGSIERIRSLLDYEIDFLEKKINNIEKSLKDDIEDALSELNNTPIIKGKLTDLDKKEFITRYEDVLKKRRLASLHDAMNELVEIRKNIINLC